MSASTVLVVNDHTAAREELLATLRGEGFTVEAFSSAAHCLEECDFRQVACAVVHHDMKAMTGFELARAFQTGWLAIPTILLARAIPADLKARAEAGIVAVLGIPPETALLCDLIRKTVAV